MSTFTLILGVGFKISSTNCLKLARVEYFDGHTGDKQNFSVFNISYTKIAERLDKMLKLSSQAWLCYINHMHKVMLFTIVMC